MISINAKIRPFSHKIGAQCILPGTDEVVEAFPHFLRIGSREIPLGNDPLLRDFTLQQDLEKNCVWVFGKGFRIQIFATPDGVTVGKTFFPLPIRFQERKEVERLSLGCHKAQDWDLILRRFDGKEFLPLLYLLAQKVPFEGEDKLFSEAFETFYLSSFHHMMVPRDRTEIRPILRSAFLKIRSFFIQEKGNRIKLFPENPFPEGRLLHVQTEMGLLDIEWSKKCLRRTIFHPRKTGQIFLDLPDGIHSFRRKGKLHEKGVLQNGKDPLECVAGQPIYLDRFHR